MPSVVPSSLPAPLQRLVIVAVVLTLAFAWPLYDLVRFALKSQLYSHIVLIPFVSVYFVWTRREASPRDYRFDPAAGTPFFLLALPALVAWAWATGTGAKLPAADHLALPISGYVLLVVGAVGTLLGRAHLRAHAFPLAFLVFMIPMPDFVVEGLEVFLQHGSAHAAYGMFVLTGTTIFRQGLVFELPGITMQVAPECSGINSSVALFITSLVAGQLILRSNLNRTLLALAVIPLALLRNGFRILTIGLLCVHISPDMIHSYIHKQGGPIFFALSLIPFGLLLLYLRHRERR